MPDKTLVMIRNDIKKKRQKKNRHPLNFTVSWDIKLRINDLHTSVQRRRGVKIKLSDFQEEIMAKGVKNFDK